MGGACLSRAGSSRPCGPGFPNVRAWRWDSTDNRLGEVYSTGHYTATPLMIGGRVYAVTSHGQVAALDAGTGEQLWHYDPRSYARGRPNFQPLRTRGIEYWTDGEMQRILLATIGKQLVSIDVATGKTVMRVNPQFYRPAEVDLLIGDPEKAMTKLGWKPKTTLEQLCKMMVDADLERNSVNASF